VNSRVKLYSKQQILAWLGLKDPSAPEPKKGVVKRVLVLEYYRSAWMLSQCFREIQLKLIQLPLGGPKGIDDLRGQLDGQFPDWLAEARAKALIVNPDTSFLVPALLQLETVVDVIAQLPAAERERHIHRVIQMAVLAQLAKEEPFMYV